MTPTQLSLRLLRENGYTCQIVEIWNPHARIRQDLFGIIDVLGLKGPETIAVQTTSVGNVSARVRKMNESPMLDVLRAAGWLVVVHGWAKERNRWTLKREVMLT